MCILLSESVLVNTIECVHMNASGIHQIFSVVFLKAISVVDIKHGAIDFKQTLKIQCKIFTSAIPITTSQNCICLLFNIPVRLNMLQ